MKSQAPKSKTSILDGAEVTIEASDKELSFIQKN